MSPVTARVNTVAEGRVASAVGGGVRWIDGGREAAETDGWRERAYGELWMSIRSP